MENQIQKKPRILCLHGFRTSAVILKKLLGRWPETVLGKLDLVFVDAPYPAGGKSDVEGIFDPPYYEWFQANQDFPENYDIEECLAYLEDYMIKHGPFDGVLGFSQDFPENYDIEECLAYLEDYMKKHGPFDGVLGFSQEAILSAALPGMQVEGVALTKVPKIKFVIIISGAKFGGSKYGLPKLAANAFSSPVKCSSLHIIGEIDFLKEEGSALLESFQEPLVIHHSQGHTVPILDGEGLDKILSFIEKIQKMSVHEVFNSRRLSNL